MGDFWKTHFLEMWPEFLREVVRRFRVGASEKVPRQAEIVHVNILLMLLFHIISGDRRWLTPVGS